MECFILNATCLRNYSQIKFELGLFVILNDQSIFGLFLYFLIITSWKWNLG